MRNKIFSILLTLILLVCMSITFTGTALAADAKKDGKSENYKSTNMYHIDILVDASYDYVLDFKQGDEGDHADMVITKSWNPANEAPNSVTAIVKQNDKTYATVTLSEANNWTTTLQNIPYDPAQYTYTVEEVIVDDQNWYSAVKNEVFSSIEEQTDGTMVYTETDDKGNVSTIVFYYDSNAPKIVINGSVYEGTNNWKTVNDKPTLTIPYTYGGKDYSSVWVYDEATKTYQYTSHDYMQVKAINYVTYTDMSGNPIILYDANNYVTWTNTITKANQGRNYFNYVEQSDQSRYDQEFWSTNRALPDMPAATYSVNAGVNTTANGYSGKGSIIRVGYSYDYTFFDKFGVLTTWTDSVEEVFDTGSSAFSNVCGEANVNDTMRGYDVVLHLSDQLYYLGDGPIVTYDVDILNTVTDRLSVQKIVSGTTSDDAFQMTITLDEINDQVITGTYQAVITGSNNQQTDTTVTFNDEGKATVSLEDGETITISGLPKGVGYTVVETITEDEWAVEYKTDSTITNQSTIGGSAVVVTNMWIGERKETLVIHKTLASDTSATNQEFTVQVTVTGDNINAGGDATFSAETLAHRYKGNEKIEDFTVTFVNGVATFTIKADETVKIPNMPENANYAIAEIGANAYTSTLSGPSKTAVSEGVTEVAYTLTNAYTPASLAITKVIDDASTSNESFKIRITLSDSSINETYTVSPNSSITFTNGVGEMTITAGETMTITGLPGNVTATVEEVDATGFIAAYKVGETTTSDKASVSLVNNETVTVTVTNTRRTGDLAIGKVVVSPLTSCFNHSYTFRVLLSDTSLSGAYTATLTSASTARGNNTVDEVVFTNGVATVELFDGETLTIQDLPTGVGYEVREVVNSDLYDSAVTNGSATGTIPDGTVANATAASVTYTNTHKTTELTVKKVVNSLNTDDHDKEFIFTVQLHGVQLNSTIFSAYKNNSTEPITISFSDGQVTIEGASTYVYIAEVKLKSGESLRITGLPVGVNYNVSEAEENDFTEVVTSGNANGMLNGATSVTYTNTKNNAPVKVSKTFTGLSENAIAHMMVEMTFTQVEDANGTAVTNPQVYTVKLNPGNNWTASFENFPSGYYKVTEAVSGAPEGYVLGTATLKQGSTEVGNSVVHITKGSEDYIELVMTNAYDTNQGYIKVTKTFAQNSELYGEYFEDNDEQITITIYKAGDTTKTPVDTLTLPRTDDSSQKLWNDTSIALPVGDYVLEESNHLVDGYTLSQTWTGVNANTTNVVTVTKNDTATVGLENQYTQDKGTLTVTKAFDGLPEEIRDVLLVKIIITDNTEPEKTYVIDLPKTSENSNQKIWTDTIELPVGVYRINEAASEAEGYTLSKAEWTGLSAENTVTITKDEAAPVTVNVQNTYTDDYGYLTINKVLTGLETQDNEFTFKITSEDQDESVAVVTVGSNGRGSTTVNLPVGKYIVEELISNSEDSRYKISYTSDSNNVVINGSSVTVDVTSGAQLSFTCTNTNLPRLSVKVPLEKTVKVTGNTVPGQTTFSFGAEWSNPAQMPIDVSFEDAGGNTIGEVKKTATNAYAITANGEGTVKGYIVIRGFADDLNGFELTTWEKLNPYGNIQAMKDAHWNYDQTAQNSSLCWKVTFSKKDDYTVSYDIALGQESGKSKIAFENVYEEVAVPELPATGDEDMPLLWALLIALSVGGLVLLRKRFAK